MTKLIVDCYFFFLCILSTKGKNENVRLATQSSHDDSPITARALAVVPLTNTETASIPSILPSGNLIPANSNGFSLTNADISVKENPKSEVQSSNAVASLSNPSLIPTVFNNVDTTENSADVPPHYASPEGVTKTDTLSTNLKDSRTANLIPSNVNDTFAIMNAEFPQRKSIPPDFISKEDGIIVPNSDNSNEHNSLLPKLYRVDTALIPSISSNQKKVPISSANAIGGNKPEFRVETGETNNDQDRADSKTTKKGTAKGTTKRTTKRTTKAATKATAKATTKAAAKHTTKAATKATTKAPKATTKAAAKSTTKTAVKTTAKATTKATTKAATKTTTKVAAKTTAKATMKATTKAATKTTAKATTKGAAKTTAKAAAKGTSKPTTKAPAKATTKAPAKTTIKASAKTTAKGTHKKTTKKPSKTTKKTVGKKTTKKHSKTTTKKPRQPLNKNATHPTNPTNATTPIKEVGNDKPVVSPAPIETENTTTAGRDDSLEWTSDKTVDWINKYLENLARRFPKTTTLVKVGKSADGVPIYAIEVVQMYITGATIVIDAGMEATDRTGVTFAIFVVHQLIERLNQNLLSLYGVKIVIVPLVNPDGYSKHLQGIQVDTCKQDFNTNFEIGVPTTEQGCVKGRSTHPETIALSAYYKKLTQFKLYINLMGGSASIYYPYGIHSGISVKSATMAQNMKAVLDSKGSAGTINIKSFYEYFKELVGTAVDWCYDKLKVRYSMQVWILKLNNHEAKMKAMVDYFEAVRYAILELQLTDAEVAAAIYSDYNSIGRITVNVNLLVCVLLTLLYFK